MSILTLADVQANLPRVIDSLRPGEDVLIVDHDRPIAKLTGVETTSQSRRKPRVPGSAIGQLTVVSDDDDHLKDFAEYMP